MKNVFVSYKSAFITLLTMAFVAFWLLLRFTPGTFSDLDSATTLFTNTYGVVALIGGVFAILTSRKWGGSKSLIGRAIMVLGLGLLAQEFGQLMYAYYIYVQKIDVPYPSLGDIGYFGSVLLYIYGTWLLAKATGVKLSMKKMGNKVLALALPVILLAVSYSIFLRGYEFAGASPLTVVLDFGYPLLQSVYLALALLTLLLSTKYLGGIMKPVILAVLIALTVQYVADFTFLYQVQHETWSPGGVNDLIYLISYCAMSVSLAGFYGVFRKLNQGKQA